MQKLHFEQVIQSDSQKVWDTMLGKESYKVWTVPFSPGSYYEGDLVKGSTIYFLGPHPETGKVGGMVSVVNELDIHKFISFKHIGFVSDGVEDFDSEEVKKWVPAYENYTFEAIGEHETKLLIDVEMIDEYAEFMGDAWVKSLEILKGECEK